MSLYQLQDALYSTEEKLDMVANEIKKLQELLLTLTNDEEKKFYTVKLDEHIKHRSQLKEEKKRLREDKKLLRQEINEPQTEEDSEENVDSLPEVSVCYTVKTKWLK